MLAAVLHGASCALSMVNMPPPVHVAAKIPSRQLAASSRESPFPAGTIFPAGTTLLAGVDVDLSSFFDTPIPPAVTSDAEKKANARREAIAQEEALKEARAATAIARMEAENERKIAFADKLAASGVPPCTCMHSVEASTSTPSRSHALTSRSPRIVVLAASLTRSQASEWPSPVATWCYQRDKPACSPQRYVHVIATASSSRASALAPS